MRSPLLIGPLLSLLLCSTAHAQVTPEVPDDGGVGPDTLRRDRVVGFFPELSFSNAIDPTGEPGLAGPVRFTALGVETYVGEEITRHFGFYGGLGWRHVGFIRTEPDTAITYKYRTWNLSASAGFVVGNVDRGFVFTGMTVELPFNYRERRFEGGEKVDAYSAWFSDRTRTTSQALVFGYQAPFPVAVKCMYYLNPFFRARSVQDQPGVHVNDVSAYDPHILSISIQLGLFAGHGYETERPVVNGLS